MKKLRQQLPTTNVPSSVEQSQPVRILKFGSWNIDGIEAGTVEALQNIVNQEDLNVREILNVH